MRRLEELGLAKQGTWRWFVQNGGITNEQAEEVLGPTANRHDPSREDAKLPFSHRIALMAHAAWKQDLMSEGQLAELLEVRRVELRKLLDQIELEENETDELLRINH